MPVILVATDFAASGNNAAYYAAGLAKSWDCALVMLHTYFVPVNFNDPAMPVLMVDDLRIANTNRMNTAVAALQLAFPEVEITARIDYGDIQDSIGGVIEELKPLLLVIGSHAAEEDSFWTGNTSGELLRNIQTPILAVPAGYTYQGVAQMCIAVDEHGIAEGPAFVSLQSFLKHTGAGLHLLHISAAGKEANTVQIPFPAFAVDQPVVHSMQATGSIDEAIADFAGSHEIDWLVLIPHEYSFWESLFHKSHTKAIAHRSAVPVLALH